MNSDIRLAARCNMIPLWKIAGKIGVSEMTVIRWLRTELPDDKRKMILGAIESLKQEAKQ